LPGLDIQQIHFFTARVKARPSDPSQPARQQAYLRALETLPHLCIHYGRYAVNSVTMLRDNPAPNEQPFVRVIKTEEKGSDVNLAAHLLLGAFRGEYEIAVVISNDSDLKEPIRIVTEEFHKPVIVLVPMRISSPGQKKRRIAQDLKDVATIAIPIDSANLTTSQFPNTLSDKHGQIHKPVSW
jgi:uncharacterized LabA/DUF88 family protein